MSDYFRELAHAAESDLIELEYRLSSLISSLESLHGEPLSRPDQATAHHVTRLDDAVERLGENLTKIFAAHAEVQTRAHEADAQILELQSQIPSAQVLEWRKKRTGRRQLVLAAFLGVAGVVLADESLRSGGGLILFVSLALFARVAIELTGLE